MRTGTGRLVGYAAITVGFAAVIALAAGDVAPTLHKVTNTTSGKNQNANIDKKGRTIVFTSNTNHVSGVTDSATGAFDFDNAGNDPLFETGGPHPDPVCLNCDHNSDTGRPGDIYVWRLKSTGGAPANSVQQLTFSLGGGFTANSFPDIAQAKANIVAWDSDQNHTGANGDGNREIFLADLTTCNFLATPPTPPCTITQVTNSTGGGGNANRSVNISDTGQFIVFDSSRDYAGVLGCTLPDGTTACDNSDNNSEIMLYDRIGNKLTQITSTTGNGGSANIRARISPDGRFIAFQSTRDFSGVLPAGVTCTLIDGISACGNSDQNGEIMWFDRGALPAQPPKLTQVTNTTNTGSCSGNTPSERVEISKNGTYVTFQSRCEAQLNPTGCVSCDGNDEAFLYSAKNKSITQVTISSGGFNRVPRISGKGGWIILESNRNYKTHNPGHSRTLYIVKRNTKPGSGTVTGPGQLIDDPGPPTPPTQSTKTKLAFVNPSGGFNSSIEQFGASSTGKFFSFDNSKGVGNQEIWFINRSK